MNKRKEIWILVVGTFASLAFLALLFTLVFFGNWNYLLFVLLVYYLICIVQAFYLFNSKKRIVNVRLCWIFVIFCIPVFGLFIFWIFGINPLLRIRHKRYLKNQEEWILRESFADTKVFFEGPADGGGRKIFNYAYALQSRPVYFGNEFTLVAQRELFSQSIRLIRGAKRFIHLQYYILSDSVWFRAVANELIKQARNGIKVRLIYDWVGSYFRRCKKILKQMKRAGVLVSVFNPKTFTKYTSKTNFRCHRKCLIVDNEAALYGGSNLADEYLAFSAGLVHWYDSNVLIRGPIVNTINLIFCLDWVTNCALGSKQRKADDLNRNKAFYLTGNAPGRRPTPGTGVAQFFETNPSYRDFSLSALLADAFASARKRIWITTPYCLPNDAILDALKFAAASGIDVRVVMPGLPDDKKYILTMNRSHYGQLIGSGIKVYEYNGFIHSKILLIDDLAVCGTSNLDFRSLYINYESAAIVRDAALIAQYDREMDRLFAQSAPMGPDSFSGREKRLIRFKMWFLNIYHPLL